MPSMKSTLERVGRWTELGEGNEVPAGKRKRLQASRLREAIVWFATFLLLAAGLVGLTITTSTAWHGLNLSEHGRPQSAMPIASFSSSTPNATLLPLPSSKYTECPTETYDDLLVTVKTGASIVYQRALVHLQTTLRCLPHKLLVSDIEMDIGPFHFVDVIKDLDADTLSHPEFEFYHQLQQAHANHDDIANVGSRSRAWDLDRFKFVPMVWRAWQQRRPSTMWFVFMEADSLIDWTNLRILLDSKDANQPLLFGAPVWINDIPFAHGGSGFILSRAAMEDSVGKSPEAWLQKWGPEALRECCGDFLLGRALRSFGINMTAIYPLLQGDPPQLAPTIPDLWCRPVVTMHHVTARQVASYWTVAEEMRQNMERGVRNTSLLWRDMFTLFIEQNLKEVRLDWDNMSLDWEYSVEKNGLLPSSEEELEARSSAGGCQKRCQAEDECRQWSHRTNVCKMSRSVRGGNPVPKPAHEMQNQNWVSGWMLDRIQTFKRQHAVCPDGADWHT